MRMKSVRIKAGTRMILLVMILTLFCAATAQAQEGPADDEYGNPADIPAVAASDSGDPSVAASDGGSASVAASDGGSASVAASDGGSASVAASDGGSASASTGAVGSTALLPLTGGASLFALGVGVLLAGAGLIVRKTIR